MRGVEGFPEVRRFDPDRLGQQTVPTAVNGRAGQLPLEVPDSLESGVAVVVHSDQLIGRAQLSNRAYPAIASSYAGLVADSPCGCVAQACCPYAWLADNTRWMRKPRTYGSLEACLRRTAATYRRADAIG